MVGPKTEFEPWPRWSRRERIITRNASLRNMPFHPSPHQLPDRIAPGHELEGSAEAVVHFQVGGDAEAIVDGGDDVGGGDGVAAGAGADPVAGAMHVAGLDAAAGQEQ